MKTNSKSNDNKVLIIIFAVIATIHLVLFVIGMSAEWLRDYLPGNVLNHLPGQHDFYSDYKPENFPHSTWSSDSPDVWIEVPQFSTDPTVLDYPNYVGEAVINGEIIEIEASFYAEDSLFSFFIKDDHEKRVEGFCTFYDGNFVVKVRTNTLLEDEVDKIVFVKQEER